MPNHTIPDARTHPTDPEAAHLEARILGILRHGFDASPVDFDALALEVFRFQFNRGDAYRTYCRSRGVTPETLSPDAAWYRIPAVPTDVFQVADLISFPLECVVRTFRTSGTTHGTRGRHHFRTLTLYEAAMVPPFKRFMLPERQPLPLLSLIAPAVPDSSLSYMVSYLASRPDVAVSSRFFVGEAGIQTTRFLQALEEASQAGTPVMILATALALKQCLDVAGGFRVVLPPGSRVMQTGGVKGLRTTWSHRELLDGVASTFGVPVSHCVAEYGMTELSSQMYETALWESQRGIAAPTFVADFRGTVPAVGRPMAGPPWLRWAVVDPVTEAPLPPGEPGLIRFFDLANLHTVSAVQTSDMGVRLGDRLLLLGRAAQSTPRGCSLTAEEQAAWEEERGDT